MNTYSRSHLSDAALLTDTKSLVARDCSTTAELLANLAEVEERKAYVPAGYPSMQAYCEGELHMSEDVASKRIRVARAARRFPVLFAAVADGRLHLAAVVMLAPYLTAERVEGLVSAATHKSKSQIETLLAERFPRSDVFAWEMGPPSAPGRMDDPGRTDDSQAAAGLSAPGRIGNQQLTGVSRVTPLSADSVGVEFTMSRSDHELLRYAQALLGHQVPSGNIGAVVVRLLKISIPTLERDKFAATTRPRRGKPGSSGTGRCIPAAVRREVWERDQGQCTFVSESGHRCEATKPIEFDHITPVARGGEATVENIRLRCRAHNQYEAERMFGVRFMQEKRDEARRATEARRAAAAKVAAQARAEAEAHASAPSEETLDVIAGLRSLGFRAEEARRAAARTEALENITLEERLRAALKSLGRRPVVYGSAPASVAVSP